jgi:hypothetical protein
MAGRTAGEGVQVQAAKQTEAVLSTDAPAEGKPKRKRAKVSSPPRPRKPRAKKSPPRLCARWVVFDGTMKQVAIFEYRERAAADQKLADMRAKNKGSYFMQIVKEPMPEPPEVTGAA